MATNKFGKRDRSNWATPPTSDGKPPHFVVHDDDWAAGAKLAPNDLDAALCFAADDIHKAMRGMTEEEMAAQPRGVQVATEIARRLRFGNVSPDARRDPRLLQPADPTPAAGDAANRLLGLFAAIFGREPREPAE